MEEKERAAGEAKASSSGTPSKDDGAAANGGKNTPAAETKAKDDEGKGEENDAGKDGSKDSPPSVLGEEAGGGGASGSREADAQPAVLPSAAPAAAAAADPAKPAPAHPAAEHKKTDEGGPAASPAAADRAAAADSLADRIDAVDAGADDANVGEDGVDEPDLSLKTPGLRDVDAADVVEVADGAAADASAPGSAAQRGIYAAAERFEDLGLSPALLRGLYEGMKFDKPSAIQAKTLPVVLAGPPHRSLIAQAHNGAGKTTCFALAMLSRVDPALAAPQALCVCPTRELVVQNLQVVRKMGQFVPGLRVCSTADPGPPRRSRVTEQVVVGAHGGLKNWIKLKRLLPVDRLTILVFDEADYMLARDGFGDDSTRLLADVRARAPAVQVLLFSATFSDKVAAFCRQVAPGAHTITIPKDQLTLDAIRQYRVPCAHEADKAAFLQRLFGLSQNLCQTVVFVRRRRAAADLARALSADGYSVTNLTGDLDNDVRLRVVDEFRSGRTKVLIATDVLSRGFDLETISLVVNFDVPVDPGGTRPEFETYLHRIGRSGRFGRKGAAFNLSTTAEDARLLDAIEAHFARPMTPVEAADEDALEALLQEAGI